MPVFRAVGHHPLVIKALIGEVKYDRKANGDFAQWRASRHKFDPGSIKRVNDAMSHVFEYALNGLDETTRRVLHYVSAFRAPATYDTLAVLLIGADKPCADETALDAVLTSLEDRGLLGWDKRSNRYDLHPVVRGVAWRSINNQRQKAICIDLVTYITHTLSAYESKVSNITDIIPDV